MSRFVLKIKGRGYFSGLRRSHRWTRLTKEEAEEMSKYEFEKCFQGDWRTISSLRIDLKRNISDVPSVYIFDSEEDALSFMKELKTNPSRLLSHINDFRELSEIDKFEIVPFEENNLEKRVVKSKRKLGLTRDILNLVKPDSSTKPLFCNNCGCNIYEDECVLKTQYTTICIHCLKALGDEIQKEYDKVPEKYKGDYLLARSVEM